jgi:hypothetical protein
MLKSIAIFIPQIIEKATTIDKTLIFIIARTTVAEKVENHRIIDIIIDIESDLILCKKVSEQLTVLMFKNSK